MSEEVERAQRAAERATNDLMQAIGDAAEAKYAAEQAKARHDTNLFAYASSHRNLERKVAALATKAIEVVCEAFATVARDAEAQSRERHPSSPKGDKSDPEDR